jgi:hypothetical protein
LIAEWPPLIIPSPVDDTDSDEQAPQSAQNLNVQAEHGGNSVKLFRGAMDTVQAEMVQIAGEMIPISLLTAKMLLCDPRRNPFFMLKQAATWWPHHKARYSSVFVSFRFIRLISFNFISVVNEPR